MHVYLAVLHVRSDTREQAAEAAEQERRRQAEEAEAQRKREEEAARIRAAEAAEEDRRRQAQEAAAADKRRREEEAARLKAEKEEQRRRQREAAEAEAKAKAEAAAAAALQRRRDAEALARAEAARKQQEEELARRRRRQEEEERRQAEAAARARAEAERRARRESEAADEAERARARQQERAAAREAQLREERERLRAFEQAERERRAREQRRQMQVMVDQLRQDFNHLSCSSPRLLDDRDSAASKAARNGLLESAVAAIEAAEDAARQSLDWTSVEAKVQAARALIEQAREHDRACLAQFQASQADGRKRIGVCDINVSAAQAAKTAVQGSVNSNLPGAKQRQPAHVIDSLRPLAATAPPPRVPSRHTRAIRGLIEAADGGGETRTRCGRILVLRQEPLLIEQAALERGVALFELPPAALTPRATAAAGGGEKSS